MTHRIAWASRLMLGAALLLLAAAPAPAFITRLMPLKEVLSGQQFIFTAKVDTLAPDKPALVLNVDVELKGKVPFRRLPVNMTGDTDAQKNKHTEKLFKRLKPGLPVMVFAGQLGNKYVAFVYTDGTWFQVLGQTGATPDKVVWSLVHGEPYLRRTYSGSTADLKQIVIDGLAKKKEPPEPNSKEEPGFGPEVQPDKKEKENGTLAPFGGRGPTFAVIPTVFIMGPLALLAALFPAVFGGLALFMKRWMAVLMVACTNSTLFTLHWWFLENDSRGAWWGSKTTLWIVMTWVAFAGVFWSARRYRTILHDNHSDDPMPRRGEQLVLLALSVIGLASVASLGLVDWHPLEWRASAVLGTAWKQQTLMYWAGAWAGGLYLLYLKLVPKRNHAVPCEMIVLAGMLFACANLTTLEVASASQGGSGTAVAVTSEGEPRTTGEVARGGQLERVAWTREIPGNGRIDSSPLVHGNRVYVAVSHAAGFIKHGILYCLDRDSGQIVWQFDAKTDLKEVFSSPCIADGKLYVGDGLHYDKDCHLFCIDAATGKELWRYTTESHVESSPCVGGGKVFVGAGDDGVVCCNAETGDKLWKYQPGLHVDASPTLAGNRLYAGSGVSRTHKQMATFCLDAATGEQKWRVDVELPVWGSPTVAGDRVYFGLGKGQIGLEGEPSPGAVLCVDAETGRRLWQCDVSDAVFTRPLVDEHHVYFGCRDGFVYGVSRLDGKVLWKHGMGSQVVASPRLARCSACGAVDAVFVVGSEGRVSCLEPNTGKPQWTFDLARHSGKTVQAYATPAVVVSHGEKGDQRRIFIGAGSGDRAASTAKIFCLEDFNQ